MDSLFHTLDRMTGWRTESETAFDALVTATRKGDLQTTIKALSNQHLDVVAAIPYVTDLLGRLPETEDTETVENVKGLLETFLFRLMAIPARRPRELPVLVFMSMVANTRYADVLKQIVVSSQVVTDPASPGCFTEEEIVSDLTYEDRTEVPLEVP